MSLLGSCSIHLAVDLNQRVATAVVAHVTSSHDAPEGSYNRAPVYSGGSLMLCCLLDGLCLQERKNRDLFRQLLQKHRDEGIISVRMRWKDYASHVEDTEEYQAVVKNSSGSRPRELFEDLIIEMEEEYDKARTLIKEALKEADWTASHDSTYMSFVEALDSQAAKSAEDEGEHRLVGQQASCTGGLALL